MAFDYSRFGAMTVPGNTGLPTIWGFVDEDDTFVQMEAANYFNGGAQLLEQGDMIVAKDTTGLSQAARITDVTSAGVVTISGFSNWVA